MKHLTFVLVFAALGASLPIPASAATAHNSQAGAYGPTTNNTAPTHRHLRTKTTR